jgi:hypothetical protein
VKPRWLDRYTVMAPYLALCLSADEFAAATKHCGITDPGAWLDEGRNMAVTHCWPLREKLVCIVTIHPEAKGADPIQLAASLCHEAVHVFQRMCDSIGEDSPSKEFMAYSIERIAENLMREFARRMK